jgi:hypothetical protein
MDKFSSNSIAAQSCIAFLEAGSLQDTLLLNLMASKAEGTPGWEWAGVATRDKVASTGVADNYTRPTRGALLYPSPDGTETLSAFVTSGAAFADGDAQDDPLIPHCKVKDKYLPFRHEPDIALWRSANVLLSTHDRPLGVLGQLSRLSRRYDLGLDQVSLRVAGITGKLGQVKHYLWRDESLPFGFSVIADDERYAGLDRAIREAEAAADVARKRIYGFAARYLQNGTESAPDKKDIGRLADEISPDLVDFWAMLAPEGERIACDGFDEQRWADLLKKASEEAFRRAVHRLPPDARRYRAEFVRADGGSQKRTSKQGKGATA